MTVLNSGDYGALAGVVAAGGSIMAAGGALGLAWRGKRTRWEPSQEDVPGAGEKVSSLLAAVGIALMYFGLNNSRYAAVLTTIAIACGIATFVLLLGYGFLVAVLGYDQYAGTGEQRRIIGGFRLTPGALEARKEYRVDNMQELFLGRSYDPESMWTRNSRALAKTVCEGLFILFLVCGTITLGAAAVRWGLAISPHQ